MRSPALTVSPSFTKTSAMTPERGNCSARSRSEMTVPAASTVWIRSRRSETPVTYSGFAGRLKTYAPTATARMMIVVMSVRHVWRRADWKIRETNDIQENENNACACQNPAIGRECAESVKSGFDGLQRLPHGIFHGHHRNTLLCQFLARENAIASARLHHRHQLIQRDLLECVGRIHDLLIHLHDFTRGQGTRIHNIVDSCFSLTDELIRSMDEIRQICEGILHIDDFGIFGQFGDEAPLIFCSVKRHPDPKYEYIWKFLEDLV